MLAKAVRRGLIVWAVSTPISCFAGEAATADKERLNKEIGIEMRMVNTLQPKNQITLATDSNSNVIERGAEALSLMINQVKNPGQVDLYNDTLITVSNQKGLAMEELQHAQQFSAQGDFKTAEKYVEHAKELREIAIRNYDRANEMYLGTLKTGNDVEYATAKNLTKVAEASFSAATPPFARAIQGAGVVVDYWIDKTFAGDEVAKKQAAENLVSLIASAVIDNTTVAKNLDKGIRESVGKSGLYQALGKIIEDSQFKKDIMRLVADQASGAAKDVAQDFGTKIADKFDDFLKEARTEHLATVEKAKNDRPTAQADASSNISLREEARRESYRDQQIERVQENLRIGDKVSEAQLAKSVIDAHGLRVRMEGYIVRPDAYSIKHLIVNSRETRTDQAYELRTYQQPNTPLSQVVPLDEQSIIGAATAPSNFLKVYEAAATNMQDNVFQHLVFGDPISSLPCVSCAARFMPGTINYIFRLFGPDYDVTKISESVTRTATTVNYVLQASNVGVLQTVVDVTLNNSTGINTVTTYDPSFSLTGTDSAYTLRFPDSTTYGYQRSRVMDNGTILAPVGPSQSNINYEEEMTATEFHGRKIDIIYPTDYLQITGNSQF